VLLKSGILVFHLDAMAKRLLEAIAKNQTPIFYPKEVFYPNTHTLFFVK